jgi:HEAT repeat protein
VPALLRALTGSDEQVRLSAMAALGKLGPAARTAVPRLLALAATAGGGDWERPLPFGWPARPFGSPRTYPSSNGRRLAVDALGEIGPDAAPAVPLLYELFGGRGKVLRDSAAVALGRIGRLAVPFLAEGLKAEDAKLRRRCVVVLRQADRQGEEVALLAGALHDPDGAVRGEVIDALRTLGPRARTVVPELLKLLGRAAAAESGQVVFALGSIGPEASAAVPVLIGLVKDKKRDGDLRGLAAQALGEIKRGSAKIIPVLTEALRDEDAYVRQLAATALGAFGAKAKAAAPELRALAKDESAYVRRAAARALKQIEGPKLKGKSTPGS